MSDYQDYHRNYRDESDMDRLYRQSSTSNRALLIGVVAILLMLAALIAFAGSVAVPEADRAAAPPLTEQNQ